MQSLPFLQSSSFGIAAEAFKNNHNSAGIGNRFAPAQSVRIDGKPAGSISGMLQYA
jgi:hypothetical protein